MSLAVDPTTVVVGGAGPGTTDEAVAFGLDGRADELRLFRSRGVA